jgi:hypothetical protein
MLEAGPTVCYNPFMPLRRHGWALLFACLLLFILPAAPALAKPQARANVERAAASVRLQQPTPAPSSANATLSRPDATHFPQILAYLDLHDAQGQFLHGLLPGDVQILENGVGLPVDTLQETRSGMQFVTALNLGAPLAVQNSQAVSRLDQLMAALSGWARSRLGTTLDDLSLVISDGTEVTHTDTASDLLPLFAQELDARNAQPSLDVLSKAISLASDPSPRPGMGKAILFITPPLDPQVGQSLDSLGAQASQQGIRLYIWMVSSPGGYSPQSYSQLQGLAEQTGGQFYNFTGEGQAPDPGLPDLESFLEPLRSIYSLTYTSQVRSSGTQQVIAQVRTVDGQVETPPQSYEIDLRPPDPAFISPPLEIVRQPPEFDLETGEAPITQDYEPQEQLVEILVSFPDERVRPLTRTTLYVNGVQAAENTQPPFERFTWNLTDIASGGSYSLRVEAEDSLGLVGSGIEHVVQVNVEQPAQPPLIWLTQNMPAIAGLAVVLAGAILIMVLVLGGKIRPAIPGRGRGKPARRKNDPVTQPVPVASEAAHRQRAGWATRLHWPQRHVAPQAYAFLSRLSDSGEEAANTPISITAEEITLGSDPRQAMLVLNDPSVDALHARMTRLENGCFRLADQESVAGTWVNYTPVSQEGVELEHGDLVHIGRVGFRFTMRQPTRVRRPVVRRVEPQN